MSDESTIESLLEEEKEPQIVWAMNEDGQLGWFDFNKRTHWFEPKSTRLADPNNNKRVHRTRKGTWVMEFFEIDLQDENMVRRVFEGDFINEKGHYHIINEHEAIQWAVKNRIPFQKRYPDLKELFEGLEI